MTTPSVSTGAGAPGPERLVLVRHAESLGNVADREARQRGAGRLELDVRDADVELSDTGRDQARAVGEHLRTLAPDEQPTLVLSSPYRRAVATAREAVRVAGTEVPVVIDERLRERDLGVFDGLTGVGIREHYPEEARRRRYLGKFYYRPPSGESWCDVAFRVRGLLAEVDQRYAGARLWVFTHQAVIMSFRLAVEGLEERELLSIDEEVPLPNCSLTTYRRSDDGLRLVSYADTVAVDRLAAPVTDEPEHAGRGDDVAS